MSDEGLPEVEEAATRLVEAIRRYMNGLGAVGVVIPTPPRPKMDALGKLMFGATLAQDAVMELRR